MKSLLGIVGMLVFLLSFDAVAQEQRVIKVLPHFLDLDGLHARSPSLFERDAYQARLRENPEEQSGIRYDILWQSYLSGDYTLKLELVGKVQEGRVNRHTVERPLVVTNQRRHWDSIEFSGEEFKAFGDIVAWRVSMWSGEELLARKQSFLWE